MYYSETKVILGGLAHVPILIFIVNFIQGKFEAIAANAAEVIKEEVKSGEVKANAAEVKDETEWQWGEVKKEFSHSNFRSNFKKYILLATYLTLATTYSSGLT